MVALLVDRFYRSPDKALLGEIRLSERELGGTVESRLRLRWTLPNVEDDAQLPVPRGPGGVIRG